MASPRDPASFNHHLAPVWLMLAAACAILAAAAMPAVPETPARAGTLLLARSFTLEEGFPFRWSAEQAIVREGTILVLEVDPALIFPRNAAEPVLYVGSHVAQRISKGDASGRLVVFVPARVDLEQDSIWFGSPELPERVDSRLARNEASRAAAAGIVPFSAAAVRSAYQRGGEEATFENRLELLTALHELVLEYLPREERR